MDPLHGKTIGQRVRAAREFMSAECRRRITQEALAELCGWGQTRIGNYERDIRTPDANAVQVIANVTGCRAEWIQFGTGTMKAATSTADGTDAESSSGAVAPPGSGIADNASSSPAPNDPTAGLGPPAQLLTGITVAAWDEASDVPDDTHVAIPLYDVELSAGDGAEPQWIEHEGDSDMLFFLRRWYRAKGVKPKDCKALRVHGDSMAPAIKDGYTVVIDTSKRDVEDDQVYAVVYYGELFIKRLFRLPGGGVVLHSDNPQHPQREVEGSDLEHLIVLGKQIWLAG